jgi:hypothetical protein
MPVPPPRRASPPWRVTPPCPAGRPHNRRSRVSSLPGRHPPPRPRPRPARPRRNRRSFRHRPRRSPDSPQSQSRPGRRPIERSSRQRADNRSTRPTGLRSDNRPLQPRRVECRLSQSRHDRRPHRGRRSAPAIRLRRTGVLRGLAPMCHPPRRSWSPRASAPRHWPTCGPSHPRKSSTAERSACATAAPCRYQRRPDFAGAAGRARADSQRRQPAHSCIRCPARSRSSSQARSSAQGHLGRVRSRAAQATTKAPADRPVATRPDPRTSPAAGHRRGPSRVAAASSGPGPSGQSGGYPA